MFDHSKEGQCNYKEFVKQLRGPLSKIRKELCLKVFDHLDKKKKGVLEFEDVLCNIYSYFTNEIQGYYNAKAHPDVKNKRRSEEEILSKFLDTFEQHHCSFVRIFVDFV